LIQVTYGRGKAPGGNFPEICREKEGKIISPGKSISESPPSCIRRQGGKRGEKSENSQTGGGDHKSNLIFYEGGFDSMRRAIVDLGLMTKTL